MKFLLSLPFLFSGILGYGASFIVKNGETVPGQVLDTEGDIGIVEAGGEILAPVFQGVNMFATGQQFWNHGLIRATSSNNGVISEGDNALIVNTNSIITNTGDGIDNRGSNSQVFQTGSIRTEGTSALGITHRFGTGAYIVNGGSIETVGSNSQAVNIGGQETIFINNGSIRTEGFASQGIVGEASTSALLINTGSIVTEGNLSDGIFCIGGAANKVVVNSGTVVAKGIQSDGISISCSNTHVIISGTVVSLQAQALDLGSDPSTNPTLTLLRGSNLQGFIQAGSLNLNVETGLNLAFSMDTVTGFSQIGIEAPYVILSPFGFSNFIGVIDPTGPSMQSDIVADLSDTFLNGIYRHRTAFPCCCNPCDCGGHWIEVIGSRRERDPLHYVSYNIEQEGFLVGYSTPFQAGYLNLFLGGSFGEAVIDQRTQTTDFKCYVGGLSYERLFCDSFIGLALVAGYADLHNHRYVMYHLAPGGVEEALALPSGFFMTPEVTYAQTLTRCWCQPIVSGTIRYAGLFLGSYSEAGSVTNLTIKDRDLHLLTIRAELGFPLADRCCNWEVEPYIGGAGRFELNDSRIKGELLGESLLFHSAVSDKLGYFLVGFRGERSVGCLDLFLNLEANWDNANSFRVLGEGRVSFAF